MVFFVVIIVFGLLVIIVYEMLLTNIVLLSFLNKVIDKMDILTYGIVLIELLLEKLF